MRSKRKVEIDAARGGGLAGDLLDEGVLPRPPQRRPDDIQQYTLIVCLLGLGVVDGRPSSIEIGDTATRQAESGDDGD